MRLIFIFVAVTAMLFTAVPVSAQLVVEHTDYHIVGEYGLPVGLAGAVGDMMFSSDGETVYFLDESEEYTAKVRSAPVLRDGGNNVTGFGTMTWVLAEPWMDTGLELAPGSSTIFFRGWDPDVAGIGQRRSDGSVEYKQINNYTGDNGGLAFVPPVYSNAGSLLSASYDDATIFMHAVSDDGDGTFTVANGSLVADFSALGLTAGIGDIEFLTSGPLADTLLVAFYNHSGESVSFIELDPSTGLPAGGTTPTPLPFLSGTDKTWGLAVDPLTGYIWVTTYDPTVEPHLVEIAAPIFADGFESGNTTAW